MKLKGLSIVTSVYSDEGISVILKGAFNCAQHAARHMVQQRGRPDHKHIPASLFTGSADGKLCRLQCWYLKLNLTLIIGIKTISRHQETKFFQFSQETYYERTRAETTGIKADLYD